MGENSTTQPQVLRPAIFKASLIIASIAWIVLILALYVRRVGPILVAIAGWPVVYGLSVCGAWLIASMAATWEKSGLLGPATDLQLRILRGPMVWFCNAAVVLLPLGVLIAGILGLCGVLPVADTR
jgi:hypothetical protein